MAGLQCRGSVSGTVINYNRRQLQDLSCLGKDGSSSENASELHLCFNYIAEVPAETLTLYTHLTDLSLACNHLTSLPPSLQYCCPQLKRLNMANNALLLIENLEGLDCLEFLDLRCNKIRCLDNISKLTNLKELSVSGNLIDSVCWPHIPPLPSLYFLGLYGNKLTDLEDLVRQLSPRAVNLKRLNIGCNPFSDDRQLSLQAALLSMNHLDAQRARELFVGLKRIFSTLSTDGGNSDAEIKAAVESVCVSYAQGRDCQRLSLVATILLRLKLYFPYLENIDETKLPFND